LAVAEMGPGCNKPVKPATAASLFVAAMLVVLTGFVIGGV
jgi:hypothetical protein